MHESNTPNPFADSSPEPYEATVVETRKYPTALRVYAILGLILGILGVLTAFWGFAVSAVGPGSSGAAFQAEQSAQVRMQQEMAVVAKEYQMGSLVLMTVQLALCAALITGAVLTLLARPAARRIFLWACGLLLVFEPIKAAYGMFVQWQTMGVMRNYQEELFAGPSGEAGMPPEVFEGMMIGMLVVGIGIALVWLAAKLVYFGLVVRYLRRPETKAFFAGKAAA